MWPQKPCSALSHHLAPNTRSQSTSPPSKRSKAPQDKCPIFLSRPLDKPSLKRAFCFAGSENKLQPAPDQLRLLAGLSFQALVHHGVVVVRRPHRLSLPDGALQAQGLRPPNSMRFPLNNAYGCAGLGGNRACFLFLSFRVASGTPLVLGCSRLKDKPKFNQTAVENTARLRDPGFRSTAQGAARETSFN